MRSGRSAIAANPLLFGRRFSPPAQKQPLFSSDDVRLFTTAYAAGFAFVAVLIA